jgi:hypothetical protein
MLASTFAINAGTNRSADVKMLGCEVVFDGPGFFPSVSWDQFLAVCRVGNARLGSAAARHRYFRRNGLRDVRFVGADTSTGALKLDSGDGAFD